MSLIPSGNSFPQPKTLGTHNPYNSQLGIFAGYGTKIPKRPLPNFDFAKLRVQPIPRRTLAPSHCPPGPPTATLQMSFEDATLQRLSELNRELAALNNSPNSLKSREASTDSQGLTSNFSTQTREHVNQRTIPQISDEVEKIWEAVLTNNILNSTGKNTCCSEIIVNLMHAAGKTKNYALVVDAYMAARDRNFFKNSTPIEQALRAHREQRHESKQCPSPDSRQNPLSQALSFPKKSAETRLKPPCSIDEAKSFEDATLQRFSAETRLKLPLSADTAKLLLQGLHFGVDQHGRSRAEVISALLQGQSSPFRLKYYEDRNIYQEGLRDFEFSLSSVRLNMDKSKNNPLDRLLPIATLLYDCFNLYEDKHDAAVLNNSSNSLKSREASTDPQGLTSNSSTQPHDVSRRIKDFIPHKVYSEILVEYINRNSDSETIIQTLNEMNRIWDIVLAKNTHKKQKDKFFVYLTIIVSRVKNHDLVTKFIRNLAKS